MIENDRTNELRGQTELSDFLPGGTGTAEGYDAEGRLLNADYPPVTAGTEAGGATPPLQGEDTAAASGETHAPGLSEGVGRRAQTPAEHLTAHTDLSESEIRLSHLATEINAITEQTRGVVISAALAVGKRLVEAKSLCPEGRFGEWLAGAASCSERKAQDMMRLYLEYGRDGAIPESIAALDYSKAVALLAAPAEAREALAEKAAGEALSVRQLQEEIRALKRENDDRQLVIDGLRAESERSADREEDWQGRLERSEEELRTAKRAIAGAAEKISLAQLELIYGNAPEVNEIIFAKPERTAGTVEAERTGEHEPAGA